MSAVNFHLYLKRAISLTSQEEAEVVARMSSQTRQKYLDSPPSDLTALASQLELEDEQLAHWRTIIGTLYACEISNSLKADSP